MGRACRRHGLSAAAATAAYTHGTSMAPVSQYTVQFSTRRQRRAAAAKAAGSTSLLGPGNDARAGRLPGQPWRHHRRRCPCHPRHRFHRRHAIHPTRRHGLHQQPRPQLERRVQPPRRVAGRRGPHRGRRRCRHRRVGRSVCPHGPAGARKADRVRGGRAGAAAGRGIGVVSHRRRGGERPPVAGATPAVVAVRAGGARRAGGGATRPHTRRVGWTRPGPGARCGVPGWRRRGTATAAYRRRARPPSAPTRAAVAMAAAAVGARHPHPCLRQRRQRTRQVAHTGRPGNRDGNRRRR